ncbi:DNA repair protein RecO [Dermatophilus congolensis]|uniref:DNA repair protein RecO n=1 Tax=Dermatophilus congolensis TaxID=1863 RepID=A0AA46H081_9MICO|nr:DNA repair protein RecO [Dermatophilus congolensis]MBO3142686.1 DNA repair protein RecO [Dermatophilus congolensis]MBO3151678.1 DNA repair protein RecO [Dermatophilus congolensis]MBO3161322.1 DNA repair protein RecO [Dermatophilus congolensis]MBO3162959.1 DNA repair protein RecO [Dermatophilus congolensis]MBO3176511.1 DNA repair protein RecO [Dermatophilus congolensis]
MPLYREAAIVLRTTKLAEADRIITLLGRERGLIRAVGKGIRKTRSRFGARLEPGLVIDAQFYEGRNLDTVTQVEVLAPYGERITRDYDAWTAMIAMLEAAERFGQETTNSRNQFTLLAGALASIAAGEHDISMTLDAYLLRSVALAGWAPSFHDCAKCGATGPHKAFNLTAGGTLCPHCRIPGSATPALATLTMLGALLEGDWDTAEQIAEPRYRREGSGLVRAYVQWHLERGVRALKYVERN